MIAAVVVTYSAPAADLDRCLRALCAAGGVDHVVIVDTGRSACVAPDLADRAEIVRVENRGYGAAANVGFTSVGAAESVALLNDDVVVRPGWLGPLVDALAPADVGAVQPALVCPDEGVVASLGVVLDRHGAGADIGDGKPLPIDRSPHDLGIFSGGAVLFDGRFLRETGGFDERFFLYYEDVDLALRGRALGWRYLAVPESTVEHRRGTSTGKQPDETRRLQERNRLWIAFRYGSVSTVARALWLSIRRLRHRPAGVHVHALASGVGGAPRLLLERIGVLERSGGSTGRPVGTGGS